jgi:hypothetical protein
MKFDLKTNRETESRHFKAKPFESWLAIKKDAMKSPNLLPKWIQPNREKA